VPAQSGLPDPLRQSVDRWLHLWDVPQLEAKSRIEWSPRLTRSLGRCYPDKRLIRIASYLESAPDGLLQEVLCHEMAHLATRELHGRKARPHGPEWKALMQKAGFEPRTHLPAPNGAPRLRRRRRSPYVYLHRCPVCQIFRTARRLMSRWRCAACVTSGLEGRLTITRHRR
jgi:predicted SprT family Zn-dependent metalloprotease